MSPLLLKRLSDEQLGGRVASGEAAAFDELYRRYAHRLSAYGAHLLGDGAGGDDVAQSALLKAYGALREGRVPQRMKPWLYRIAHNVAIDLVARRREVPTADLPDRVAAPEASGAGALLVGLAALPERQRNVYVLRELHGLRIDETAAELGLTVQQVEQSLFAARSRLAEHLVFGDRLNCVTVQRLAAGPLDLDERRALKTHLRSCSSCRSTLGLRGRVLGALPTGALEWIRALGGLLSSGGAPVAAKVGILVAGASFAGVAPVAVEHMNHRLLTHPAVAVHVRTRHALVRRDTLPLVRAQVVTVASAPVVRREADHHRSADTGTRDTGDTTDGGLGSSDGGGSTGTDGGGGTSDGGSSGPD